MSDNWLTFIPTNPEYVPDAVAQVEAKRLLESFVPQADEVNARVTSDIQFIDQGGNFIGISCPVCEVELDTEWWGKVMDHAHKQRFTNLMTTTPCCGSELSLNDLYYQWPAGFARFTLEAMNPNVCDISHEQFKTLQQALGCELRKIGTRL